MFNDAVRDNLLALVDAYQRATGKSLTAVSKEFYGRGDFFDQFARGEHTISIARLGAMLDKFAADWPEGTEKPVLRPVFMLPRRK